MDAVSGRLAAPADVPLILALVGRLAACERLAQAFDATEAILGGAS